MQRGLVPAFKGIRQEILNSTVANDDKSKLLVMAELWPPECTCWAQILRE